MPHCVACPRPVSHDTMRITHRACALGRRALRSYSDHMTDSASQEVDLDLRLVGYFVAVADHRHFGRAAAALLVAQPSLSRQIRRLEQQMGVRLFDRTPQSTRLTEAVEG